MNILCTFPIFMYGYITIRINSIYLVMSTHLSLFLSSASNMSADRNGKPGRCLLSWRYSFLLLYSATTKVQKSIHSFSIGDSKKFFRVLWYVYIVNFLL